MSYDLCEFNNSHPGMRLKVDPGSKTTGVAIVHQETGEIVFAAEIQHRGQAIKKNLDARRAIRRGRRNRMSNLVCACRKHNEEKNDLSLEEYGRLRGKNFAHVKAQAKATLKDATTINATRWALFNRLKGIDLPIETGSGGLTKFNRTQRGLIKEHWIDAACVGRSTPEKLGVANVQPLRIKATGRGTRQKCSTNKYGFPIRHRTQRKTFMGFQTGDMVKADIPRGKYAGRYVSRVTIRQRPSFILNGYDAHPKYLKRIHRSDGYEYQEQIKNGSRANGKRQKAHGHTTTLP
jgi:hypothetical protein